MILKDTFIRDFKFKKWQVKQMNEIGEILKQARIEKGYTLDDLQQITKIQKRYLEAIEKGNTDILPGRFYARAFVKQYADIVGLDGEELLDEHLDEVSSEEVSEEFAESISSSPSRVQGKEENVLSKIGDQIPTILIFILVAAILVVIYFAFRQTGVNEANDGSMISDEQNEELIDSENDDTDDAENSEAEEEEEVENEEETDTDNELQQFEISNSTGDITTYEVSGPHPEEQTIVLSTDDGESWVSIQVDGETVDSTTLSAGASISADFAADTQTINLRIGNAGVTKITLNDNDLDYGENSQGTVQNMVINFIE